MTIEVEEQGYSISRKMINDLYQVLIQNGLQHTANEMYKTFRSRPHSPLTQNTTDCPHHCSVFRNGFDNNAPMEHHCDFLNNTCEVEEEKIRQDEREKVNKIFDHTRALCDAIIEKLDCQSKLGFNAMLIKRDIESLRAGKDGEPELKDMTIGTSGANR